MEPVTLPTLEEAMKPESVLPPSQIQPPVTEQPKEEAEKPPVVEEPVKDDKKSALSKTDDTAEPPKEPEGSEQRKDESTSAFIKRIKSENAANKQQAAQLKAEIEKLRSQKGTEDSGSKLSALEAEAKELREQLEITAFERSPKFKTEFLEPIQSMTSSIKEMVSDLSEEEGIADKALSLKGKARLDFLKDSLGDAGVAVLIHEKVKGLEALEAKKDAAMQDSQKRAESLVQNESNKVTEQYLQKFDALVPQMQKQLSALRTIPGNDEHNALAQQSLDLARKILSGEAHIDDMISAPLLAVAAPIYINQNKVLTEKVTALEARIAEYEESIPEVKGKGSDSTKDTPVSFKVPTLQQLTADLAKTAG